MNNSVGYYFYYFSGFYLSVYVFAVIILLAGATFFKNNYRIESYNLLYIFNTLAAWCSIFILLYFAAGLFIAWYGQNPYEWYAFSSGATIYSMKRFYLYAYFPSLFGLVFFFRKMRIKRFFTLFFLLLLNLSLFQKLMDAFRDYQPAFRVAYYAEPLSQKIIKYSLVILFLTIIYLLAKKKNKLPYPSLFLK